MRPGAATSTEEDVAWDEDSDDESTPKTDLNPKIRPASIESSTTIHPQPSSHDHDEAFLKPSEPRKSHDEKSQADSEASYDVVGAASGAPSHAPGSPKDSKKGDDSEEEDWE